MPIEQLAEKNKNPIRKINRHLGREMTQSPVRVRWLGEIEAGFTRKSD